MKYNRDIRLESLVYLSLTILYILSVVTDTNAKQICGPNQFRCKNGRRCISALHVCDGVNHCKDGQDETPNFCKGNFTGIGKFVTSDCSAGMYRCRFGGCINATRICDGHPDCFDSSDETNDLCGKNRCNANHFRCDYGACVRKKAVCNGKPDCLDGSDETREVCSDVKCPPNAFKCNYGACVPEDKVCDKRHHCLDRSDEWTEHCKNGGGLKKIKS